MLGLGLYQTLFLMLVMPHIQIHGLFHFKKLNLERQAKLAQSEKSGTDFWIEQKLDHFQPQDTRKWMQVSYHVPVRYDIELCTSAVWHLSLRHCLCNMFYKIPGYGSGILYSSKLYIIYKE